MIKLNDILNLSNEEIHNTKIRFNKGNDEYNPIELFIKDKKRLLEGHFWNYKVKSFKVGQIVIGLFRIDSEKWLLFDISIITEDLDKYDDYGYKYESIEKYKKYFGRVIVKYKNRSQNLIRRAESVIEECEVVEIIDRQYEADGFPGYDNVDIPWRKLSYLLEKKDWITALSNQKGIYLITDTMTGKRYVGSAYGENMIYGRWKEYSKTCHGGNKDLKLLDVDYMKNNFRYTILEIYKSTTDDNLIIRREQHWMKILLSKKKDFGYNN